MSEKGHVNRKKAKYKTNTKRHLRTTALKVAQHFLKTNIHTQNKAHSISKRLKIFGFDK